MRCDATPVEDFSMWAAFKSGGQDADVAQLKELVGQWIQLTTQKTAGQRGGKDLSWDNMERIKMGILAEAVALVLSGDLDALEAKEKGLLVELPCKRGDVVWRICGPKGRKQVAERTVLSVTMYEPGCFNIFTNCPDWLGKTVFLTREEAEQALTRYGKP